MAIADAMDQVGPNVVSIIVVDPFLHPLDHAKDSSWRFLLPNSCWLQPFSGTCNFIGHQNSFKKNA